MMLQATRALFLAAALVALASCHDGDPRAGAPSATGEAVPATPTSRTGEPATGETAGTPRSFSRAQVDALRADLRALAKPAGCTAESECASVDAGAKACGGASMSVVFCTKSSSEVEIRRAAQRLTVAERQFNEANGIVSDCAVHMAPPVVFRDGECAFAR